MELREKALQLFHRIQNIVTLKYWEKVFFTHEFQSYASEKIL